MAQYTPMEDRLRAFIGRCSVVAIYIFCLQLTMCDDYWNHDNPDGDYWSHENTDDDDGELGCKLLKPQVRPDAIQPVTQSPYAPQDISRTYLRYIPRELLTEINRYIASPIIADEYELVATVTAATHTTSIPELPTIDLPIHAYQPQTYNFNGITATITNVNVVTDTITITTPTRTITVPVGIIRDHFVEHLPCKGFSNPHLYKHPCCQVYFCYGNIIIYTHCFCNFVITNVLDEPRILRSPVPELSSEYIPSACGRHYWQARGPSRTYGMYMGNSKHVFECSADNVIERVANIENETVDYIDTVGNFLVRRHSNDSSPIHKIVPHWVDYVEGAPLPTHPEITRCIPDLFCIHNQYFMGNDGKIYTYFRTVTRVYRPKR